MRTIGGALVLAGLVLAGLAGCSRAAPDATPEGAVRMFVDRMETASEDPRAMKEAFLLLGPHARANLRDRAERASKGQGRRYEPWEMLAEGRFGLKFRPKSMTAKIEGQEATVEVRGEGADERASVHCTREAAPATAWRVEPDLPPVPRPPEPRQ